MQEKLDPSVPEPLSETRQSNSADARPESAQPERAQGESAQGESAQPESAQGESAQPESAQGESAQPGRAPPEGTQVWLEAYQDAQRQLVEVQGSFQRAMTESHLAFLAAMGESLAGLRTLAHQAGADLPPQEESLPLSAAVEETPLSTLRSAEDGEPAAETRSAPVPESDVPESDVSAPEPSAPEPSAPEQIRPDSSGEAEPAWDEPGAASRPIGVAEKPWAVWDESADSPPASTAENRESPVVAPESPAESGGETPLDAKDVESTAHSPQGDKETGKETVATESASPASDSAFGRFALQAEAAAPVGLAMSGLASASRVVVTEEGTGVARALVEQLQARGVPAEVVTELPADASGAILLGGLSSVSAFGDTLRVNREAFMAARNLARRFTTGRGMFVSVQDTGGDFGLTGRSGERAGLGGLAGLAKTARLEWPGVTVKAIDLERGGRPAWKLAKVLAEELFGGGPELEVGLHADGRRVALQTYQALLNLGAPQDVYSIVNRSVLRQSSVIVASGGARGITAAALIALARNARPRMVLLGRTPLEEEPEALRQIDGADALREALYDELRRRGEPPTADEVEERLRHLLAAREIRANVAALHRAGSEASYHAVDIRDPVVLADALTGVRNVWGPITGIVHGAGVASDSLLTEKTEQEFDQVFSTKVEGLFNLLQLTAQDPLDLMLLFSSSAARTGRRGQADSAMANEVLNKMAAFQHARRGNSCLVKAFNWSYWEETQQRSGARSQLASGEPRPIPPDVGARMLVEEIQAGISDQVEVILGMAPEISSDPRPSSLNMLTMDAFVGAATHPFIEGYKSDGIPALPLALILEWFIRITRAHCPDLEMVTCHNIKMLRSVRLEGFYEGGDAFTVVSHQQSRVTGRELALELYARDGTLRYTASAHMARPGTMVTASEDTVRLIRGTAPEELQPWPFSSIYGHALFQGPECQTIREIEGVSDQGLVAVLAGAREMGWSDACRTDMAALEGGLQLAVLWFQQQLGGTALPTSIRSYHSHFSGLVEGPIRAYLRGSNEGFQRVVCDVAFVNENGTLLGELRGVEARAFIKPVKIQDAEVAVELEPAAAEDAEPFASENPEEEPEVPAPEQPEVPAPEEEQEAPAPEEEQEAPAPEEEQEAPTLEEQEPPAPKEEQEAPAPEAELEAPAPEEEQETPARDEEQEPAEVPDEQDPAEDPDVGSTVAFSPAWQEKATKIAAVIDALLGYVSSNVYVVFSSPDRGELVRFVGGDGKLYLDLPGQYLGPELMPRAEAYFASHGVKKEFTELYEAGRLAERFESFGLELGNDVGHATQMALDLFSEVYQLDEDFELEIQES